MLSAPKVVDPEPTAREMQVIRAFVDQNPCLYVRPREISVATGLDESVVKVVANTLVAQGVLRAGRHADTYHA